MGNLTDLIRYHVNLSETEINVILTHFEEKRIEKGIIY